MKQTINRWILSVLGLDAGQNKCWEAFAWYISTLPKMKVEHINPDGYDSLERYCPSDRISEYQLIVSRKLTKTENKELRAFIAGLRFAQFDAE